LTINNSSWGLRSRTKGPGCSSSPFRSLSDSYDESASLLRRARILSHSLNPSEPRVHGCTSCQSSTRRCSCACACAREVPGSRTSNGHVCRPSSSPARVIRTAISPRLAHARVYRMPAPLRHDEHRPGPAHVQGGEAGWAIRAKAFAPNNEYGSTPNARGASPAFSLIVFIALCLFRHTRTKH